MGKWIWGIVITLVLIVSGGIFFLYQFGGLRYYLRAVSFIKKLPTEQKVKASVDFYPTEENLYSGTLAGTWNKKVWIWGGKGLKYFNVDQDLVYSYTDGCSEIKLSKTIQKEVISDFNYWKQRIKEGDFVTVLASGKNIKEIYSYNWWWFLGKDMKTECAK